MRINLRIYRHHQFLKIAFLISFIVYAGGALGQNNSSAASSESVQANHFRFGLNEPFTNEVIKNILGNPSRYSLYNSFYEQFNITHIRYPGGSASHFYFWDDSIPADSLSSHAVRILYNYFLSVDSEYAGDYGDKFVVPQLHNYEQFLRFTVAAGIHPSIVLNTVFYHENGELYPLELLTNLVDTAGIDLGLQPDRWSKIQANLVAQLDFTHSIIPGNITWELGNEEYRIHDPRVYGSIVEKYLNIIKAKYPNDITIVSMARGAKQRDDYKKRWNTGFVQYVLQRKLLYEISLFSAHYYAHDFNAQDQPSINARIRDTFITKIYIPTLQSFFPKDSIPYFHITETTPLRSIGSTNFNTQINALLMWDHLLKFYSDPMIKSLTKHTGTDYTTGLFFTKASSATLSYVDTTRQDSPVFSYIPPQADAARIFYDVLGKDIVSYNMTSRYEMLVRQTKTKTETIKYIKILNYTAVSQSVNISSYGSGSYTTYTLTNLHRHYWDAEASKQEGTASGTIILPAHSFTTLIIHSTPYAFFAKARSVNSTATKRALN